MKQLDTYLSEKLVINKNTSLYTCQPKDVDELRNILKERLAQDKNADLNDIDVSQIKDMSYLFENLDPHNIDINGWNISNVTNMVGMFENCNHFNMDISKWDVFNVEDMNGMFSNCNSLKNKPSWYKE